MSWEARSIWSALATMALVCIAGSLPAQPPAQDPKAPSPTVEAAIAEAVKLLEMKDYKRFVETFVAPDDLKQITAQVPLETLIEFFAQHRADHLLKVLRSVQKVKPELDEGSKTATFTVDPSLRMPGLPDEIIFVHVNGRWYMRN